MSFWQPFAQVRRRWFPAGFHLDPFLALSAVLGILLFLPLRQAGLPQASDALLHFYRAAAWRWAWDDGVLWPRWHTLLHQGLGYPVLNFQAPLLYVLAALASFVTADLLTALKAILLLACVAYATGMYLWAREILGRFGAIVASAAYTFAAFRFRELYFLGGYAQFLAWALYPWALFAFLDLARRPTRGRFLAAILALSGIVVAHNISAMLFAPLLGVYVAALAIAYRRERAWRRLGAALICAALLSAVFWLPALREMAYTRVSVLTEGHFDVSLHFVRPADLIAAIRPLDERAANPPLPFTFGRWHLLLAAIGALTLIGRRQSRPAAGHLVGMLILVGACIFMMLPESLPVWRSAPLLGYAEYPWRMYGVAFLGSSLLAGAAMTWFATSRPWRRATASIAIAGLLLSEAAYQFPRPFLAVEATPDAYLAYEQTFRAMGTTGADEFLSRWVTEAAPSIAAVRPGEARVALVDAPQEATATAAHATARGLEFTIQAQKPVTLTLAQFYFPGWTAWLDGAAIALWPAGQTGLIQLAAPAGEHRIRLEYRDTPTQQVAGWLTLVGLLAAGAATWRMRALAAPALARSAADGRATR